MPTATAAKEFHRGVGLRKFSVDFMAMMRVSSGLGLFFQILAPATFSRDRRHASNRGPPERTPALTAAGKLPGKTSQRHHNPIIKAILR